MLVLGASLAAPALGAGTDLAFSGPAGWSHVTQTASDPSRQFQQWRFAADPPEILTVMKDTTTNFADAIATMKKNIADNGFKVTLDSNQTCQGRPSHITEFAFGPQGHTTIINRLIVPQDDGIVTVTYTRGEGFNYDDDVKKAVAAYCKPA